MASKARGYFVLTPFPTAATNVPIRSAARRSHHNLIDTFSGFSGLFEFAWRFFAPGVILLIDLLTTARLHGSCPVFHGIRRFFGRKPAQFAASDR
jgi:hypothetical protein